MAQQEQDQQQPRPKHLNFPEEPEVRADKPFLAPWMQDIDKRWAFVAAGILLVGISVFFNFYQGFTYEPENEYFTASSGYPVYYNEAGRVVVDSVVYRPGPFRYVLNRFVENRYEYDWMSVNKINDALSLMSEQARNAELRTLQQIGLRENIIQPQIRVQLDLDWSDWELVPLGNGRFQVQMPGKARVLDAVNHTDPANPAVHPVEVEVVLQAVRASTANPYGYMIISTGKDLYWQIQDATS